MFYSSSSKNNKRSVGSRSSDRGFRKRKASAKRGIERSRFAAVVSSRSFRLVVVFIAMATLLSFVIVFVEEQRKELSRITFSRNLQEGLDASDVDARYSQDGLYTFLFLVMAENEEKPLIDGLILVRYNPSSHSADLFSVHPDLYVPLQRIPGRTFSSLDLSDSKVKDLMVIGELQNPPSPLAYALYQIEELYALEVDGYMVFPPSLHEDLAAFSQVRSPWDTLGEASESGFDGWTGDWLDYWDSYLRSISLVRVWAGRDSLKKVESNMDVLDVYQFAKDYASLADENIIDHVVPDEELEEVIDERGEIVNSVGLFSIDELFAEVTVDKNIEREQARIEILNGTNINGLGGRYDRWVSHLGGTVIRVKNAPGRQQRTQIYVTDIEAYEYTLERISGLWERPEVIEGRPDFITTGDIIIIVGMDL